MSARPHYLHHAPSSLAHARHRITRSERHRQPNLRTDGTPDIRKACEDSLRRLQTDHIDLYQMQNIDPSTPVGGGVAGDGTARPRRQGADFIPFPWSR
ncbi:MAG TPA: aldo/keto reductase, partial [Streptosporangiaceae bacterium]|nr:aldo/keto reductase [Streptosporangiaceae bacterium]